MKCPVCRKTIEDNLLQCPYCNSNIAEFLNLKRASMPTLLTFDAAYKLLFDNFSSRDIKLISITGENGIGKTFLLNKLRNNLSTDKYNWVIGKCTPLTQLSVGGVIQDMFLNLFSLPNYCVKSDDIYKDASEFFANEFKFLTKEETDRFINFLYPEKDGNYEDIIINKHKTFAMLKKIFDVMCRSGKFVFVVDNMNYIDGFSIEFFTKFISDSANWKSLKLIAIYKEHKPISAYFPIEASEQMEKSTLNLHLGAVSNKDLEESLIKNSDVEHYISKREKDVILARSDGNYAFVQQALCYCFDCQIADKSFLLTDSFEYLIKERLETLKKINLDAYKVLCLASVVGFKFNLMILKKILGYNTQSFNDIVSYLVKSKFIHMFNNIFYEFNNIILWETILKTAQKDALFEDINIKAGKALSAFNINTNATMAMIAHNLRENRMAFDIWTKISRLASYSGDINLYVVAQRQCLALLNEFNENETIKIRYNISERLGKLLTEYSPQEAMEYLPDAIANAVNSNDEVKEIELLGYMAKCCLKTSNYLGYIECADNVLKKFYNAKTLEIAMVKATKMSSVVNIGNYGEAVNLAENDVLPVLNNFIAMPKLDTSIPVGFVFETKLYVLLYLAKALAFQGDDRSFEVLAELFENLEKYKNDDINFLIKAKLVLAYANVMKGNFETAREILSEISVIKTSPGELTDNSRIDLAECVNELNFIYAINMLLSRQYEGLREVITEGAIFANDSGYEFCKHLHKVFLGKLVCDSLQAKTALNIYDDQISYFAEQKFSFGAILTWYYIAEATLIIEKPLKALDIASQALEISQNPKINNYFLSGMLKLLIAKIHIELSDFQSAGMYFDGAMELAKKYSMMDLMAQIYYEYGRYYAELGRGKGENKEKYLEMCRKMYDKAGEVVERFTKSNYWRDKIIVAKRIIDSY